MHVYDIGVPFERIAIYAAGTFPRSDQGNRYLRIAVDYFAKWLKTTPFPIKRIRRWRKL
jgi:hypothetical protein